MQFIAKYRNKEEIAKRVGVPGARLLPNVAIRAAEASRRTEQYSRTAGITAVDVLVRLTHQFFTDMTEFTDDTGVRARAPRNRALHRLRSTKKRYLIAKKPYLDGAPVA